MFDARAFFGSSILSEEWSLPTRHLGQQVVVLLHTDSTNTQALRLIDRSEYAGLALLADEQLAGRGQHGRSWFARPRASVLLSILLFPPEPLTRPVLLTAWAAVAVCRLVRERTGLVPRIKWPNDVLINDRKISGILIEQVRHGSTTAVVIGIGLNVAQSESDFAEAGLLLATSLSGCGDPCPERDEVARQLLTLLDEQYGQLLEGRLFDLEGAWRAFLDLDGKEVLIDARDMQWTGHINDMTFDGLRLVRPGLESLWLTPESIRQITHR